MVGAVQFSVLIMLFFTHMTVFRTGNIGAVHFVIDKIYFFPNLSVGIIADGGAVSSAAAEMKLCHDLAAGKISCVFTLHLPFQQIFLFLYCLSLIHISEPTRR